MYSSAKIGSNSWYRLFPANVAKGGIKYHVTTVCFVRVQHCQNVLVVVSPLLVMAA